MKGAIAKAEQLKEEYGNAFIPQQFTILPILRFTGLQQQRKSQKRQTERLIYSLHQLEQAEL